MRADVAFWYGDDDRMIPVAAARYLVRLIAGARLRIFGHEGHFLILGAQPDLFVAVGDNVHADGVDPEVMRSAYRQLRDSPEYRAVRERVRVHATWDDQDHEANDAGADDPMRDESRRNCGRAGVTSPPGR